MGTMASQITNLTIVYSTVYSSADQRKHQISASLAFVRGIHRTNGQYRGKCFHLMTSSRDLRLDMASDTAQNKIDSFTVSLLAARAVHWGLSVVAEKRWKFSRSRASTIHCDWGNPNPYLNWPITKGRSQPIECHVSYQIIFHKAVSKRLYMRYLKFDQTFQCSCLKYILPITMKFCTRPNSVTIVACAKLGCAVQLILNWRTANLIEIPLMGRVPCL